MQRRLFKTGNSIVLSLPREALESLGLADGNPVEIEIDVAQRRLIITPVQAPLAVAGVDEQFDRQVREFITKYRTALDELAR
jgi:putative addiction module antidote